MWSIRCCCSMGGPYWAINSPKPRSEQSIEQTNSDLLLFAGVRVNLRSWQGLQPAEELLAAREDRVGFASYCRGHTNTDS